MNKAVELNTRQIYHNKFPTYLIPTPHDSTIGPVPSNLSIHVRLIFCWCETLYHTVHRVFYDITLREYH